MDQIAYAYYALKFENDFLRSKGNAFQTLFENVMSKRYPKDFRPCSPWGKVGDMKNDGFLPSERILFQVYAPNELTAAEAKKKIEEDFNGALAHWGKDFDTWAFVYNGSALPAPIQQVINELERNHTGRTIELWGWEAMRQKFNQLGIDAKRAMYGYAPTNEAKQNLRLADLEAVLEHIAQSDIPDENLVVMVVPPEKIEANQLSHNVALLLKAGMEKADMVGKFFDGHPDPPYGDRVATAFRNQYQELRNRDPRPDSNDMFGMLQQWAGWSGDSTPAQQMAILAVLAYFFEQCEIFEPPTRT